MQIPLGLRLEWYLVLKKFTFKNLPNQMCGATIFQLGYFVSNIRNGFTFSGTLQRSVNKDWLNFSFQNKATNFKLKHLQVSIQYYN